MKNNKIRKTKLSFGGIVFVVMGSIVFGILGFGLPNTINLMNNTTNYGYFASHTIIAILFWMFFKDVKIIIGK